MKAKHTTKIKTWVPLFPGFYNTIFEFEPTSEYAEKETWDEFQKLPWKEQQKQIKEHEAAISEKWCAEIQKRLAALGMKVKIEFEAVYSPKEYNFTTDSLNATITVNTYNLKRYFIKHKEKLRQYFVDTYTSRDGFASFYDNDIDRWIYDYLPNKLRKKGNVLGAMLEAILVSQPEWNPAEMSETVYYEL